MNLVHSPSGILSRQSGAFPTSCQVHRGLSAPSPAALIAARDRIKCRSLPQQGACPGPGFPLASWVCKRTTGSETCAQLSAAGEKGQGLQRPYLLALISFACPSALTAQEERCRQLGRVLASPYYIHTCSCSLHMSFQGRIWHRRQKGSDLPSRAPPSPRVIRHDIRHDIRNHG